MITWAKRQWYVIPIRPGVQERGNRIAHHGGPDKYWRLTVPLILLSTNMRHNKLATTIARLWEGVSRQYS